MLLNHTNRSGIRSMCFLRPCKTQRAATRTIRLLLKAGTRWDNAEYPVPFRLPGKGRAFVHVAILLEEGVLFVKQGLLSTAEANGIIERPPIASTVCVPREVGLFCTGQRMKPSKVQLRVSTWYRISSLLMYLFAS